MFFQFLLFKVYLIIPTPLLVAWIKEIRVVIMLEVIQASSSDYGETLDYLERTERSELITREMSGRIGRDEHQMGKLSILDLRKNHPDFTLPPIKMVPESEQDTHTDYRCPYCGVILLSAGDSLTCKYCTDRSW